MNDHFASASSEADRSETVVAPQREHPIIFSGPMVRAILDDRKTQTRRVVRLPATFRPDPAHRGDDRAKILATVKWYAEPGDRLWVRETGWERPYRTPRMRREGADTWDRYYYDADGLTKDEHEQFKKWEFKRRPSIYMPRWASRITLEVVNVRVERLQEISREDEIAEGVADGQFYDLLWESINGPGSWDKNPWVWVIEFNRIKP